MRGALHYVLCRQAVQGAFNIGKASFKDRAARIEDDVVRPEGIAALAERFAQAAFDEIALHRSANGSRHGKAQARAFIGLAFAGRRTPVS
ncbi:MAG: hypothetical protein WDO18_07845 [Acidobacteriota bacterium]